MKKFYQIFTKVGDVRSFVLLTGLEAHVFDLDSCSYVCGLVSKKNHHIFEPYWMRKNIFYIGRNSSGEFVLYVK